MSLYRRYDKRIEIETSPLAGLFMKLHFYHTTQCIIRLNTHLLCRRSRVRTPHSTNIHTYQSRFIPEGVAEASQIFLRDAHVLPKLSETTDVTDDKPIAV
jgi:hypothetical protein